MFGGNQKKKVNSVIPTFQRLLPTSFSCAYAHVCLCPSICFCAFFVVKRTTQSTNRTRRLRLRLLRRRRLRAVQPLPLLPRLTSRPSRRRHLPKGALTRMPMVTRPQRSSPSAAQELSDAQRAKYVYDWSDDADTF